MSFNIGQFFVFLFWKLNLLKGTRGHLIFEFSNLFLTIYLSLSCWNTRSSSAIHWCGWIGHCVHSAVVFNYRVEIRMFHGLHSCQSLLVIIPKEIQSILVNNKSKNMHLFWNISDRKYVCSRDVRCAYFCRGTKLWKSRVYKHYFQLNLTPWTR